MVAPVEALRRRDDELRGIRGVSDARLGGRKSMEFCAEKESRNIQCRFDRT